MNGTRSAVLWYVHRVTDHVTRAWLMERLTRTTNVICRGELHQMIARSGSIEGFFAEGMPPDAIDVGEGLQSFSTRALEMDLRPVYGRARPRPGEPDPRSRGRRETAIRVLRGVADVLFDLPRR